MGWGGGSVLTPSMRRAVTIPMLQVRKWTQRGRRVAHSHTLEGAPDVNPELQLQMLSPPHAMGALLAHKPRVRAASDRGRAGASMATIIHRTGEDSRPGSGVPRQPGRRSPGKGVTLLGGGNETKAGRSQERPGAIPAAVGGRSRVDRACNTGGSSGPDAGARAPGALDAMFPLQLWQQTGLDLKLLPSSCVTLGK